MTRTFQVLIAIACIVVIVTGSFWLHDRGQRIAANEAAIQAQSDAMQSAVYARARQRVAACRSDLAAYEDGSILAFVIRANGGDILAEVSKCRQAVTRGY